VFRQLAEVKDNLVSASLLYLYKWLNKCTGYQNPHDLWLTIKA
jgi:hypothetical protein